MRHRMGNSQSLKDSNQNLHKIVWETNKWGSKIGVHKIFDNGEFLRLANIDEIVPGKEEYFIRPNAHGEDYYLVHKGFHKTAEYNDIKSFVKNKMVYVYKDFNKYGKH